MSSFTDLFERNVPHILEKIFLPLDCDTIANCVRVSRSWECYLTSDYFKHVHLVKEWLGPNQTIQVIRIDPPQVRNGEIV